MPSRQEIAEAFLSELNPDAFIVAIDSDDPQVTARMDQAGLGMASIIMPDFSEAFQATYVLNETSHTAALHRIWEEETAGMLPEGSHDRAVDSIIEGDFDLIWGEYLPKQ